MTHAQDVSVARFSNHAQEIALANLCIRERLYRERGTCFLYLLSCSSPRPGASSRHALLSCPRPLSTPKNFAMCDSRAPPFIARAFSNQFVCRPSRSFFSAHLVYLVRLACLADATAHSPTHAHAAAANPLPSSLDLYASRREHNSENQVR